MGRYGFDNTGQYVEDRRFNVDPQGNTAVADGGRINSMSPWEQFKETYSPRNVGRRMFTLEGAREAIQENYIDPGRAYYERASSGGVISPERLKGYRKGVNIPFTEKAIPGTRFAGEKFATALEGTGKGAKTLRNVVNFIPGLNLIGDVYDVAEAVVGVARGDKERQGQAKALAREMANQGLSLDEAMTYIESTHDLQDLAGNIGADDFAKTAAYAAFTGGPSLNPVAAAAGAITAGDLQREKGIRNRMFKEEFLKASTGAMQGF